jgi:RNA polymerase sigma factor (sigma-70 family)
MFFLRAIFILPAKGNHILGDEMFVETAEITNEKNKLQVLKGTQRPAEASLVEAAKSGHSSAFGALCELYTQQLLRAAHRITRSHEDAEDAVQDAMMRAFVHLRDFDGRSSFSTWLTRIAINSALMILRKKRTSREIAMENNNEDPASAPALEIPDRAPNPEKRYAENEEVRILKTAIAGLRPALREVVRIQQIQEGSMRETAQEMGISLAAAKARLFHAKLALRKSSMVKRMRQRRSGRRVRPLPATWFIRPAGGARVARAS